jgi:glutamyl-tRNA synthetase
MKEASTVRVRFAPSPTGHLHVGGARTAIYNWAFAKRHGGQFILRIEDTDPARSTAQNTEQIIRSLKWLGLTWDEGPGVGGDAGPYLQSERQELYQEALNSLVALGRAYPCFCTADELQEKRDAAQAQKRNYRYDRHCLEMSVGEVRERLDAKAPCTWRLLIPDGRGDVCFEDAVYGSVNTPIDQLDDFILVRSDGTPTYNFVACVDDTLMGITHVIRGDDHLSNTPKQCLLYEALGFEAPTFAHLSMILGSDGARLSKRHGATSVEAYRDAGYLPQAMLNYLSLLGWSLDGKTTMIDADTLAASFSLSRISKNPAIFDAAKLDWMNQAYVKDMGAEAFTDAMTPFYVAAGLATREEIAAKRPWFDAIYPLAAERIHALSEACPLVAYLFEGFTVEYDQESVEKCLAPQGVGALLASALELLEGEDLEWRHEPLDAALRALAEEEGVKPKLVFQAVRVAVCGNKVSPPLLESLELIGREATLARIRAALPLCG